MLFSDTFSDKIKARQEVRSHDNSCKLTGCNNPLDISGIEVRKPKKYGLALR